MPILLSAGQTADSFEAFKAATSFLGRTNL
jgi:hypothetical protein